MDTQTPAGADAGMPGSTPGSGPGPYPGTTPPPAPHAFWAGVRRTGLYRSDERWVGGVAGGLAQRVGVDPLVVRGLLAVTFLIGGLGLVLYGVAWALLPDARDNRILLERLGAGDADGALLGSLAFVVVGLARGDGWWWFWDGGGGLRGVLWLASVAGIVVLVVTAVQRRGSAPGTWQAPATRPSPYGAPDTGTRPTGTATAYAAAWAREAATAPLPAEGAASGVTPPYAATAPSSAAPTAPYGSAPVPPVPPAPPRPPAPSRPPRRGADAATVGAVVGLGIVALGVLMLLDRAGVLDAPVWLTAGGIALVLAGLGIVTLGLRGRTSGAIGFLAVVAAVVWVPTTLAHQSDWTERVRDWEDQGDMVVTSRAAASNGFDVAAGSSRIDLTAVPLDDSVLRVPINIGAGELTVVVPQSAAVRANVSVGAGSVRFESDEDVHKQSGVGLSGLLYEDDAAAAGSPDLVLDITSGVGEVRIIEEAGA